MKRTFSRIGCTAVCAALCLALGCSCALLPPASGVPDSASTAADSIPTDTDGKPLYDPAALQDGSLRALYSYDGTGGTTILRGSKVVYQASSSENVSLLQDSATNETSYWFRSWSDSTGRGGRRSALYDADGAEVMAFDGEQSATLQNGLLILQETALVDGQYQDYYSYGSCQVIDLATGESLPVPEGAYGCIVCGEQLVFSCYARPADLAADAWDSDDALHRWVIVQQKDGTPLYRADTASAYRLYDAANELSDWVELDIIDTAEDTTQQFLYNPATSERIAGFRQAFANGAACFETDDGRYELRDLTTEDRGMIAAFDDQPSYYFPGYVVLWRWNEDRGYFLYDLETGETAPLYEVDATGSSIAVYGKDDTLRVYDMDTGALLVDTTVEPVEHQQSALLNNCGNGYVWLELRDNSDYETTATRLYGPDGLIADLTRLQDTYNYMNYLTTDAAGRPLFYGTRNAAGTAYGTVSDVLDADGNVVLANLGYCYGYYANSLNGLPEHAFAARRGFYYGWMDASGTWIYCQNIFASVNADDEPNYGV